MSQSSYQQNRQKLQRLMENVGLADISQLSQETGISELQLLRILHGLLPKMEIEILLKLSQALQVSVNELISLFCSEAAIITPSLEQPKKEGESLVKMKAEYERLQEELAEQQKTLRREFEQASIQQIESWLLQWPTAAAAAQNNPQIPAARLLPLMRPIMELLHKWGIETVGEVGQEVSYDPQWYQLMSGTVEKGDRVIVRYVGYRQGDKLLYRGKVSPLENEQ